MRNHHKWKLSSQRSVGNHILCPKSLQWTSRSLAIRDDCRAGLRPVRESACRIPALSPPAARQETRAHTDGLTRIRRYRPRSHHAARCLKGQIEHRREIHIKSQRPAILADDLPVLAKQPAVAASRKHPPPKAPRQARREIDRQLPPSRSTQVNSGVATHFWHSRSKRQVCSALLMLRANRMTPAGCSRPAGKRAAASSPSRRSRRSASCPRSARVGEDGRVRVHLPEVHLTSHRMTNRSH